VFRIDAIFKIDRSIIVGIIVVQDINGDIVDIFTSPHTWAVVNGEWTVTIDMWVTWAVFRSPIIFDHDKTSMNFTGIGSTVSVEITVSIDFG